MSDSYSSTPPALTAPQRTLLEQYLLEAQTAQHRLSIGASVVRVRDQNGEVVEYHPASLPRLALYIENLKWQLGLLLYRTRPPMRHIMGP